jgi:hypothetical protein
MSSSGPVEPKPTPPDLHNVELRAGWEAALSELQHQAMHLEQRGAYRAAATLYDAIRIARAGGLPCEHRRSV